MAYRKFRDILPNLLTQRSLIAIGLALLPIAFTLIFAFIHRQNFPRNEEFRQGIAFASQLYDQGTVSLAPLFQPLNNIYFSVFPNALVMFSILVADWNVDLELAIIFLTAICNYGMIIAFFYKSRPSALYLAAFPLSLLVFSLHQDIMWTMGFYAALWHFPIFFFLTGLSLVVYRPDRWSSLIGAGLAAYASMLSYIGGITSFFLIGFYIVANWKRNGRMWVVWAGFVAVGIFTAYIPSTLMAGRQPGTLPAPPYNIPFYLFFFFTRLGSAFASRLFLSGYISPFTLAASIGVMGAVLLIANVVVYLRSGQDRQHLSIWLALAGYGLGITTFLMLRNSRYGNIFHTQIPWYDTGVNLFWVATVALIIQALVLDDPPLRWARPVRFANIFGLLVLAGFYVLQNHNIDRTSMLGPNPEFWYSGTPVTDYCARDYVRTMDTACLGEYTKLANRLATVHMAAYSSLDPINLLGRRYQDGDRVIVATENLWQAVHTRDWLLDGIPADAVLFVIDEKEPDMRDMRQPPEHWISAGDDSRPEWTASEGSLWVLYLNALPEDFSLASFVDEDGQPIDVSVPPLLEDYWTVTGYEAP